MRVAIVGVCGSGKTTISRALQERGLDAYVVGQEHSMIVDLWRRRHPDALVFLDASLATVRRRRSDTWPQWIYDLQIDRLSHARSHATIVVDTGESHLDVAVNDIVEALSPSPG